MLVKVAELTGLSLDRAVAEANEAPQYADRKDSVADESNDLPFAARRFVTRKLGDEPDVSEKPA